MTGGDDILYLITLRNLEIHLVIGVCCFEVCFGTGRLTGLRWYPSGVVYLSRLCTSLAILMDLFSTQFYSSFRVSFQI